MSDGDIPIGGSTGPRRPPAISLPDVGMYVDCAVINEDPNVPRYKFGTKERVVRQDGSLGTKSAVTVLVIRGTGTVTIDGDTRQVQPGEVCTIYFEGSNRYDPDLDKTRGPSEGKSWSGAKEALGRQLQVGDVMRWTYEREVPGKGVQPRRLRTVLLRAPRPEEAEQTMRCKQLYQESTAVPVGGGSAYADSDELEPF